MWYGTSSVAWPDPEILLVSSPVEERISFVSETKVDLSELFGSDRVGTPMRTRPVSAS